MTEPNASFFRRDDKKIVVTFYTAVPGEEGLADRNVILPPGSSFLNLSYDVLAKTEGGELVIDAKRNTANIFQPKSHLKNQGPA